MYNCDIKGIYTGAHGSLMSTKDVRRYCEECNKTNFSCIKLVVFDISNNVWNAEF